MKRILSYITVSVATVCALSSCQKYEFAPSMNATINGQEFLAKDKTNVTARVIMATRNPQLVTVTGNSTRFTPGTAFQPRIEFTVPHSIGTHAIGTSDSTRRGMVYTALTGNAGTQVVSGEVKISNIKDGRIQGKFTLNCADGTTVTDGSYIAEEAMY